MMRLLFLLLTVNIFNPVLTQAQNREIDSLKRILPELKNDSTKVLTLIDMGMQSLDIDLIAATRYGSQAKALAETIEYKRGIANALKLLGISYALQGKIPEATERFKESLAIFEELNDQIGISTMLSNLGNTSGDTGDYQKAIEYHLQSLKIAEELNDPKRLGTSLLMLGLDYSNMPDGEQTAVSYYRKALPYCESINYSDGIATASINIGEIYYKNQSYDSALNYLKTAISIFKGTADSALPLTYVADIFAEGSEFDSAYHYHKLAIDVTETLGAQLYLARSLLGLAKTQQKQNKTEEAINTYREALEISEKIQARQEMKEAYGALADSYSSAGDYRNAYLYRSKFTLIKDTLYNNDEAKKIQQMQFSFDINKKESQIQLQSATIERQRIVNYAIGVSGFLLLLLAIGSYQRYKFIRKTNKIIKEERDRSKELLLNILPEETARELETNGHAQTRFYESVTVLFTDFKGFSTIAGKLSPQDLVAELNDYFGAFDEIVGQFNLEKIKTIGDAYMCAGGIPTPNATNPLNAVQAALAMQDYMARKNASRKEKGLEVWELRIGLHTGPIVAGVVGKKKYAYDIWGDTVNIASRMESNGEPGKVNISNSTYQYIKEHYQCLYRGKISAKNIGEVDMYFIESKITKPVVQLA